MSREIRWVVLTIVFAGISLAPSRVAAGKQSAEGEPPSDIIPLSEEELREFSAQVLAEEPLLASSRGIKFAEAYGQGRGQDFAIIIFHPHSETAGFKQAFQSFFYREGAWDAWQYGDTDIRRYMALDYQDFDVRITGPIQADSALAVIEASRDALVDAIPDDSARPDTVVKVSAFNDRGKVMWGDSEGYRQLTMKAHVIEGGDPTQHRDWIVTHINFE